MNVQKVLVFDIETAPIEAYVWGRRDQNVSLEQVQKDWYIMCFGAKWLNDPVSKVIYESTQGNKWGDDKKLLKKMWKLLDEADIVVTQNGQHFDSRKLNARFIMAGMAPPSPYKHIDTYKTLSRLADFTSASLEYLAANINKKYKKLSHKKFPGWKLWVQCLKQNPEAWKEMKKYNIHDVLSTEELYLNTRAWTPASAPLVYSDATKCRTCGSKRIYNRGYLYGKSTKTRRVCCRDCGVWTMGEREAL